MSTKRIAIWTTITILCAAFLALAANIYKDKEIYKIENYQLKKEITYLKEEYEKATRAIAVPAPKVVPDATNKHWVLTADLVYEIGKSKTKIVVPAGFVTDFASIPQPLSVIGLSPHGKYSRAAVIHDYLYWSQGCTKKQSDNIMVLAMKESHTDWLDEKMIFQGVDKGGKNSWTDNQAQRALGLLRIIPDGYREMPPSVDWPDYRAVLMKKGFQDPQFPYQPEYCQFGNSSEVPGGIDPKPDHAAIFLHIEQLAKAKGR